MKDSMTNVDLRVLLRELDYRGKHIGRIASYGPYLKVRIKGDLLIGSKFMFPLLEPLPTEHSRESQILNRHLKGLRVRDFYQKGWDRIAVLDAGERKLVLEFFHRGNVILTDGEWRIIYAREEREWRHRKIIRGEEYRFPPLIESIDLSGDSEKRTVPFLVSRGIPPVYAEEVCARVGISPDTPWSEAPREDIRDAWEEIVRELEDPDPQVVYRDRKPVDVIPISLLVYEGLDKEHFPTFSEALARYFIPLILEKKETPIKAQVEAMERKARELRLIGSTILENISFFDFLLSEVRKASKGGREGVKRKVEELGARFLDYDPARRILRILWEPPSHQQ